MHHLYLWLFVKNLCISWFTFHYFTFMLWSLYLTLWFDLLTPSLGAPTFVVFDVVIWLFLTPFLWVPLLYLTLWFYFFNSLPVSSYLCCIWRCDSTFLTSWELPPFLHHEEHFFVAYRTLFFMFYLTNINRLYLYYFMLRSGIINIWIIELYYKILTLLILNIIPTNNQIIGIHF